MNLAESDRNHVMKRLRALLLAASDMEQASAAAQALDAESTDVFLMRALETAIAVCYARAFTQSSLYRLNRAEYEPVEPHLAELHRALIAHRDKVYAHTDKEGGRNATLLVETPSPVELPGRVDFVRQEDWEPLPRQELPAVVELSLLQRERFHREAAKIHLALVGPEGA